MTKATKRTMVEKAQGMADYEERVMVVFQYDDGDLHIRAAEDLDVEVAGDAWMTRYGMRWVSVVAPTGSFNGYSAQQILEAVIR